MNNDRSVVKIKLKKILYKHNNYYKLMRSIDNSNRLINIGCLFIRSFILYIIEKKIDYTPVINIDFVRIAFSVLTLETNKGRPYNDDKQQLINLLSNYRDIFLKETSINLINSANLSYILGQTYSQIYTNILNNILYHYGKHLWAYIKCKFQKKYDLLEGKQTERNKLTSRLGHIKDDLMNIGDPNYDKNFKSKQTYKTWFTKNKKDIIPESYKKQIYEKDVKINTFSYLKCMHHMNKYIQLLNKKSG